MFGPVERFLGLAANCLERHDDAEGHFSRSAEMCKRIGAPTWLARTRHELALMLWDRGRSGDRERAEDPARAGALGCGRLRVQDPGAARANGNRPPHRPRDLPLGGRVRGLAVS